MSLMIVSRASLLDRMIVACSCWSSSRSLRRSRPLIPMTAFIGVRISWLMVARKMLFEALASSATSRASWASAKRRALSSAIEASWARRSSRSTSVGVNGRASEGSRAIPSAPTVASPDRSGTATRRPIKPRSDPGISARPRVVVVDHDALTGGPDLTGDADAGPEPPPSIRFEQPGRDPVLDLLPVCRSEVDVSMGRAEHLTGTVDELEQELVEVEALHDADRRLVEGFELDVLLRELVGALGDAQLEPLERLAEPSGHRVEGDRQRSDLVVRRHGCFAVEVARRDSLGGVRDRQDRAGDPS